jgi:outer membrane protein
MNMVTKKYKLFKDNIKIMKRMKLLINVIAALAIVVLFTQCNKKPDKDNVDVKPIPAGSLKIAYVEIDTLLTKYNLCKDVNEAMVKKEENSRVVLNQKASELAKDKQEFQKKYDNNAFLSEDRAKQEYNRLMKMDQDLQTLQQKLQAELASENQKNSLQLRDSINAFLKDFNKKYHFNLIISNTGMDNLLYADKSMNITNAVLDGLNKRYAISKK